MAEDDLTIFVLLNATGEILGLAPIKKIVQIKKTREIKVEIFRYNRIGLCFQIFTSMMVKAGRANNQRTGSIRFHGAFGSNW